MKKMILIFVLTSVSSLNLMAISVEETKTISAKSIVRIKIKKGIKKSVTKTFPKIAEFSA